MPPGRRKKWTEAEERTLIDRYAQMIADGTLSKMKTREKKYKPIALHVNSLHHLLDPIVYPWEWTWKDVSNKVQNMRHQYSLVKQKIKLPSSGDGDGDEFEFDWVQGLTHWSNFLRYKEVFGDVPLPFGAHLLFNHHQGVEALEFDSLGQSSGGEYANGVLGMDFDCHVNENGSHAYQDETRIKRKLGKNVQTKTWAFVTNQLAQLREMEARFEQREEERQRERERRESVRVKNNEEMDKAVEKLKEQRDREWESMESLMEERRRRREEEVVQERKREERNEKRRSEWNSRMDEMLSEHRAEMVQFQSRVLDEQQNLMSQLLGMVSQWNGNPSGMGDNSNNNGVGGHYISQMMQNLQHVDGNGQVEGHDQDNEFIVDG